MGQREIVYFEQSQTLECEHRNSHSNFTEHRVFRSRPNGSDIGSYCVFVGGVGGEDRGQCSMPYRTFEIININSNLIHYEFAARECHHRCSVQLKKSNLLLGGHKFHTHTTNQPPCAVHAVAASTAAIRHTSLPKHLIPKRKPHSGSLSHPPIPSLQLSGTNTHTHTHFRRGFIDAFRLYSSRRFYL